MAQLLISKVYHRRDWPKKNTFVYDVYYVRVVLEELKSASFRLFSINRWNVMSLFDKDHGPKDGSSLLAWIDEAFRKKGVQRQSGDRIELVTHPRLFGYVFNPISFWFLIDASENLKAVLCEVRNTFGDDHNYIFSHTDRSSITAKDIFRSGKNLYVSPFNKMEGTYTFNFQYTKDAIKVSIVYSKGTRRILTTFLNGRSVPMTDRAIAKILFMYPFMTIMIIWRIHWQAVKLYLKGVPNTLSSRPKPTSGGSTYGKDDQMTNIK